MEIYFSKLYILRFSLWHAMGLLQICAKCHSKDKLRISEDDEMLSDWKSYAVGAVRKLNSYDLRLFL